MHEVLVNRLGGVSLPRKSEVRLTDRSDMTLDVSRIRKTTTQHLFYLCSLILHGPSMLAVEAKIYGVLYKQYSSIAFMKHLVIGQR